MVSLKTLAAMLAIGVFSATAAPVDNTSESEAKALVTRVDLVVYTCEHPNWGGRCKDNDTTVNQCTNLPKDWDNYVSSIRNRQSVTYKCVWYECQGRTYDNQVDANLADGDGFFDDRIRSWRCSFR